MIDLFIKNADLPKPEQFEGFVRQTFLSDSRYDLELVILKGHMLIEYTMNVAIEKLAFKKASTIADMSFSTKLVIAEAFGMFEGEGGHNVSEQIRILNKLRNDIAHLLKFNTQKFQELLKYYPDLDTKLKDGLDVDISLGLNFIFTFVSTYIMTRLKTKINLNNLIRTSPIDIKSFLLEEDHTLDRHKRAMREFNIN